MAMMKVYVELPQGLDVAEWRRRHAVGLAPDPTPYGLHRMADAQTAVAFRRPLPRRLQPSLDRARRRSRGYELLPSLISSFSPWRIGADVVVAMDERTGLPAALSSSGTPVVSGIAWLRTPADAWPRLGGLGGLALRRLSAVFTECPAMVGPLVQELGVPPEKVHVVRFGVDEEHFAYIPYGRAVEGRVFSVGDDRMRDHSTLIEAVERVHQRLPGTSLELATQLPAVVPSWLGVVHRRRMDAAVRECYERASVVAVALEPNEAGSGLTVLVEAMSSGRPVVVTNNPGLDRYVEHGLTGLMVPAGDPEAMSDAIESLLRDPVKAEEMGRAGRRSVEENFTSAHFASDLRSVLMEAVTRGG